VVIRSECAGCDESFLLGGSLMKHLHTWWAGKRICLAIIFRPEGVNEIKCLAFNLGRWVDYIGCNISLLRRVLLRLHMVAPNLRIE
jgi:hypothetical protein